MLIKRLMRWHAMDEKKGLEIDLGRQKSKIWQFCDNVFLSEGVVAA